MLYSRALLVIYFKYSIFKYVYMSFCIFELKTLPKARFQVKFTILRNHRSYTSRCPKYLSAKKAALASAVGVLMEGSS